jgi:glycosyltransferase involved in cell wall biosynthesis
VSRHISVAFSNMIDPGWQAGGQYLFNLMFAIKANAIDLEMVLRVLPGTPKENYEVLGGFFDRILEVQNPLPDWFEKLPGAVKRRFTIARYFEERALRHGGIDAQFLFADPGNVRNIPSATWFPDFQHLYLPDLFREEDLKYREKNYPIAARKSKLVILSSQHALKDLKRIAPDTIQKARILNFVAQVPTDIYRVDSKAIADYYRLPHKFFFLPNQFWRHKNHQMVFQAVRDAKKEIEEITVVCSGGTHDFRNPSYFDALLSDIATNNLQNNIRILGRIPREHVMPLMRQSIAVLQPSLFEGWSTSVEEVKSLGKQIIISDIPIHREQNPSSGLYFSPTNPSELAGLLLKLHTEKQPGPDLPLERFAMQNLPDRTRVFAQTFYNIIAELVN